MRPRQLAAINALRLAGLGGGARNLPLLPLQRSQPGAVQKHVHVAAVHSQPEAGSGAHAAAAAAWRAALHTLPSAAWCCAACQRGLLLLRQLPVRFVLLAAMLPGSGVSNAAQQSRVQGERQHIDAH